MPRILYFVNIPRFFYTHRLPLAIAAHEIGYEVHVATSDADKEYVARIQEKPFTFHPLPLAQHSTNPLTEINTLRAVYRLYRQVQPDIVHQVSIKPVIYGGLAARWARVPAVVSAMSGLGRLFVDERAWLRRWAVPVLRRSLRGDQTRMIFQNPDDRARFVDLGIVPEARSLVIRGSGVDMNAFIPFPENDEKPIVLFASRLMKRKGLPEFVQAAEQLKDIARFVVCGYAEASSPDAVQESQLEAWAADGIIEWWGDRSDMLSVFAKSHIVCLPSTYGEGVPKVLIEAAASGRAIVATDIPGCREIVNHGDNGFLVPPGDTEELVNVLRDLIVHKYKRRAMGERGREIAEAEFSLTQVLRETFAVYNVLLNPSSAP